MTAAPASRPTVSVVIPVKDDADLLRRCLRALASQTVLADEIIVVDNASTDASAQVAVDAGATVVRCETPGIPAASSCGYDHATGQIILRLDADCIPSTTWIQSMQRAFLTDPHTDAFTGGARFIDGPRVLRSPLATAYLGAYAVVGLVALGHLPVFGSNMGFRREAWRRVRSVVHRSPTVHDDFDLAFHLGEHHRIRYIPHAEMGMSMRPFYDAWAFGRRIRVGVITVLTHWPYDFPPLRWQRVPMRRLFKKLSLRKRFA